MPVVIPDETVRATKLSEDELRREIAVMLFAQEKLTLGQAAQLADMTRSAFQKVLGLRRIPIHYEVDDLQEDVANLKQLGLL